MAFVSDFSGWLSSSESSDESSNSSSHADDSSDESLASSEPPNPPSPSPSVAPQPSNPPRRGRGRPRGRGGARVVDRNAEFRGLEWIHEAIEKKCPEFRGHSYIHQRLNLVTTPINWFKHFFTKDILELIVMETNNYARKKSSSFQETTAEEIKKFIGIYMLMGIVKIGFLELY